MPVQMESGDCPRCQGDGFLWVQPEDCHHTGNCWCGPESRDCPGCTDSDEERAA